MLRRVGRWPAGPAQITVAVLRGYFTAIRGLAPATRARKQTAFAAFLRWCVRHDLITANPMDRLDRVPQGPQGRAQPRRPGPRRAGPRGHPQSNLRDRVLFGLIAATGVRASEALGVDVEDLL